MSTPFTIFLLALSTVLAVRSFAGIVEGYRRRGGFPWLAAIIFAVAAAAAVLALHGLLGF